MSGIKQGLLFIWLSIKKASSNPIYWKFIGLLFLGGIILLTIAWYPTYFVLSFLGTQFWGLFLLGLIALSLLISLIAWGEVVSLAVIREYSHREFDNDASQPGETNINLKGWQAMIGLCLASPFLKLNKKNPLSRNAYLAKPLIALKNMNLPQSIDRVISLSQNQSHYFNPHMIKVDFVSWLILLVFLVIGLGLGSVLGLLLTQSPLTTLSQRLGGIAGATVIAFIFTTFAIAISSLSRGLYAANLYQWVKDMQHLAKAETKNTVVMPDLISQVLNH